MRLALAVALLSCVPATAGEIFADNFNAQNAGNGQMDFNSFAGWNVSGGTVDLIGNGYIDLLPGNGLYVDLDGSSGTPGQFKTTQYFTAGSYTLQFSLAGNQRNSDSDTVTVTLGNWSDTFTVQQTDPFTTITRTFSTSGGELLFQNSLPSLNSPSNEGALLDNVSLSTVPEPATLTLLGGLALGGLVLRRRTKVVA